MIPNSRQLHLMKCILNKHDFKQKPIQKNMNSSCSKANVNTHNCIEKSLPHKVVSAIKLKTTNRLHLLQGEMGKNKVKLFFCLTVPIYLFTHFWHKYMIHDIVCK
jgi:hypothetical protein